MSRIHEALKKAELVLPLLQRTRSAIESRIRLLLLNQFKRLRFVCPICGYEGVFLDRNAETGKRRHAECPQCHALERHRLQWLVLNELQKEMALSQLRVLHMAPEPFFETRLRTSCRSYITADISGRGVDRREDLTHLSFPDGSFDLVYASHVLEHILDDQSAIREIRRVLSVGGVAVLPVPIISNSTVEYGEPNPFEVYHVRAPGLDYFDRYKTIFGRVKIFESISFDPKFQVWIYEDRSNLPTPRMPKRPKVIGSVHADYVPVCYD